MNKNWGDRADKDLFFTILSVKNIGVISGAEWTTIGNHMRTLGYGFTNEGCRYVAMPSLAVPLTTSLIIYGRRCRSWPWYIVEFDSPIQNVQHQCISIASGCSRLCGPMLVIVLSGILLHPLLSRLVRST